ncbi:zinc finger BED domain-containing protein RICESLEEPER 2 [Artemisia annua]|uniref:Zinc finger BED domain-containing protein RICESLEEPER 2 n=1 Tax=Artemisia annua TaxID=35608 RepID=A0A2U1M616_ARTAN|nr:zinc finger BED domain-containing protein RICESLEEPER 2 [Artemisia annua]
MSRNPASQTESSNTAPQGFTNDPYEVGIEPTTPNQEIWCHFQMVKFSDGSTKARCKACNTFIKSDGNSTLKKDATKHKYGATNVGMSSVPNIQESGKRARSENLSSNEYGRYTGTAWLNTITPEEFKDFDVLNWWEQREPQFPILAAMTRDLLSVQASTVASESTFSTSGRVLSVRRTRITPLSLEMCICLKDYLDGNECIQHVSLLAETMEYEKQLQEVKVEEGYTINLFEEEFAYDEATSAPRTAVEVEDEDGVNENLQKNGASSHMNKERVNPRRQGAEEIRGQVSAEPPPTFPTTSMVMRAKARISCNLANGPPHYSFTRP